MLIKEALRRPEMKCKRKIFWYSYVLAMILSLNGCLTADAHSHLLDAHASIVKAIRGDKHDK